MCGREKMQIMGEMHGTRKKEQNLLKGNNQKQEQF